MQAPGIRGRLVGLPLGWLLGVALQLHERELLPSAGYLSIAGAAALLLAIGVTMRRAFSLAALGALVAGFAISGWQASARLAGRARVGAARRPARGGAARPAGAAARAIARGAARSRCWPVVVPEPGRFEVIAADMGQGTAVLVRTRTHALLFDTGPQYSPESDAGQRVLLPLLRGRGDRHLDLLVLSHRDKDHVGGARSVLAGRRRRAGQLAVSRPSLLAATKAQRRCVAGQRWTWDGVSFAVLHPAAADYERRLKSNAMSCVLRVEGGGRSVLLTGDIEREQEATLVAADAAALRSDVLVVPHYGSKTSSSAPFLDAVQPRIAVFQAGYRNRFGHFAAEVLDRQRARRIAVVASPACGAWQWRADGAAAGACEREVARRYWQHRLDADGR